MDNFHYLGDIMMVAFDFIPRGFLACEGQTLQIYQNTALYALIGTSYGGNGTTTFDLPDLRGRTPIGYSDDNPIGHAGGQEELTLTEANLPQHNHTADPAMGISLHATTETADLVEPQERSVLADVIAADGSHISLYNPIITPTDVKLKSPQVDPDAHVVVSTAGNSTPIPNMQPYLGITFCICVDGEFPSGL